ncbi:MAG: hypothetical protein HY865_12555 [Chloroflexi bacterium]|nr:hypothetical protein [Chloroflexota bacterium]
MHLTFGEYDASSGLRRVTLKGDTANPYSFTQEAGSTVLKPYNGIFASLTQGEDYFILIDKDQNEYHFDLNSGRIISRTDSNGRELVYTYDAEGRLDRISDVGGGHYLALNYSGSETRIATVTDHTGRQITYMYNGNGDLVSATDLSGETWTYQYDDWHHVTRVTDPGGRIVERTEYESNTANARAVRQYDGEGNLVISLTYNADGSTILTDALGNTSTDYYSSRNIWNKAVDQNGAQTLKNHDANFRPTIITDAGGDTTNLLWSENGANLTRVVDAEGNQTDITYDAFNNPTSVIDPLNHLTTYEYDGNLLTSVTDALNGETTYTYTAEGYLESVTDPLGNTTSYTYDDLGQRTSMTDTAENTWTYGYDSFGRLVDATDPLGRVNHGEYDAAGRLTRSVRNYDPNRPQNDENLWNIVTEYQYDASGNQAAVTDTFGRTTQYEYDAAGRLVKVMDPAGNETTSAYNEAGQLVSTTDALERVTSYAYDPAGRMISTTDALGNTTTTTYNLDGTVQKTTDALGRITSYTYDDLERVLTITQPNGGVAHNTFDAAGNLTVVTDPMGDETHYEYDALGRLIKTTDPTGNYTETFYDSAGRMLQTRDAKGNATTYAYDEAGRQVGVTDARGNVTSYEYDDLGRRTAVIDAAGNRTEYIYDNLDRVVAATDPLGHVTYTQYDALGQVLSRTDANGNEVTFEYDNLGRLTSQTDAVGGETTFTYDAVGNRLTTTDARNSVVTTTYDALNRPIVVVDPLGSTTSTAYDAAGQVISTTNADGKKTTFDYNALGAQTSTIDPLNNATHYSYDAAGRMTSMTNAKGIVTAYEYGALGRLSAVIENFQAAVEPTIDINVRTEYTYDANGNRLTVKDGNNHVTTFIYDELDRLVSESDPLGNTWTYEYNALGNRVSMTDANGVVTAYEYDDSQRLTGVDAIGTEADVSFDYDAGGRRTSMMDAVGTTTWNYDELNRPTAITDPFNQTVSYVYDAAGNRTGLAYAGKEVNYTYDAANRLIQVDDATLSTIYEYDPTGRLASVLLPNGINTTYTYDAAGRLLQLQHATIEGNLASYQYTYDAVGNRIRAVENVPTPLNPTVRLTVMDGTGSALAGREVYAFNGDTYTGYHKTTDARGQVEITLPAGLPSAYRFRIDSDGAQFWSGTENHCTIGQCGNLLITLPAPVTIFVADSDGAKQSDIPIYVYTIDPETGAGQTYTGYHGTTDAEGVLSLRLPEGDYRFRADFNGTQFWNGEVCTVPGCEIIPITVTLPVTLIETPLPTPTPTLEETETPTPEATATEEPVPTATATSMSRLPGGNTFAVSFANPQSARLLPLRADTFGDVTLDEFDATTLDSAWTWVEPLAGPSWSLTDEPDSFQFTLPPDYDHWEGVNTAPSLQRTDMGTGDFAIETRVDILTENEPGDGYKFGLLVGFSETDRLWLGLTGDGQLRIYRTGVLEGATVGIATLPVYLRVEKVGADYDFLYKQNGADNWTNLGSYTSSQAVSYVGVYGSTYDAIYDVTFSLDYFRLERAVPSNAVTITVSNTDDVPQEGLQVYAFSVDPSTGSGQACTGINNVTDANGQVMLNLPNGSYRFRADLDGAQFWSGASNHCEVPGCTEAAITISAQYDTVTVDEFDSTVLDPAWSWVEPLEGPSWSLTEEPGSFQFTLPPGYDHWEGVNTAPSLQRTDMGTGDFAIETRVDQVTDNEPGDGYKFGLLVGFSETDRLWLSVNGYGHLNIHRTGVMQNTVAYAVQPVSLRIQKKGAEYTFLYKQNAEDGWTSLAAYTVSEPVSYVGMYGSTYIADYDVTYNVDTFRLEHTNSPDVTVTVADTGGTRQEGVMVYAFDGSVYTGANGITDADGQVTFTLPEGSYRFRTDLNGTQFWSGSSNHCAIPGCSQVEITVSKYNNSIVDEFDATTLDSAWTWVEPLEGPSWSLTENPGFFQFTVPQGFSHLPEDGSVAPSLQRTDMGAGDFAIETSYFVDDRSGDWYHSGLMIGFSETDRIWMGILSNSNGIMAVNVPNPNGGEGASIIGGQPVFMRIEKTGDEYKFFYKQNAEDAWTHLETYATPTAVSYVGMFGDTTNAWGDVTYNVDTFRLENTASSANLTATVVDTDGVPQAGVHVYVFDDSPSTSAAVYTGFNGITDTEGHISFNLPVGAYRFRADLNDTQFWNDEADECSVPNCKQVEVTVSKPVTVTVLDSASAPKEGLNVYAFDGTRYTGYNGTTNAKGQAVLTLPLGSYRFRADLNGTQFWNSAGNNCNIPGCTSASIAVSLPLTVTVLDTDSAPKEGLNVYAFNETTYTGYHVTTNSSGQATFTLPFGSYRFRTDLDGTQFWSDSENHCDPNAGCQSVGITVSKPVTVTVADGASVLYPNLPVYAFDGANYTGHHATTDARGQVTLTLPQGNYRFRADLNGTEFWSAAENNCALPGCTSATISLPGSITQTETTIEYTYDPLNRLTAADYSTGDFYAYTYDAVGNRLTQDSSVLGLSSPVSYTYDIANRLATANGVAYTYDANGNLLNDGVNAYVYDPANRLTTVNGPSPEVSYAYNGLGDRLSQNGVKYTLDLNAGLTQVLSDGTATYTYGPSTGLGGRISQTMTRGAGTPDTEFFLADALGSVRQLASQDAGITYAASYDPYGVVMQSGGASSSIFTYTGEIVDASGLVYLRTRYYDPQNGRFISRDTWDGDMNRPASLNRWNYVEGNPVNKTDPSGMCTNYEYDCNDALARITKRMGYRVPGLSDWDYYHLKEVNDWWDAGVRFSRNSISSEDKWTAANIYDAVDALNRTKRYLNAKTSSVMGTLLFLIKSNGVQTGGKTNQILNEILLFLPSSHSEEVTEAVIHEIGHILDWRARPKGSQWGWSVTSKSWLAASGWAVDASGNWCQDPLFAEFAPTDYAKTDVGEDFAETFLYLVENGKMDYRYSGAVINVARKLAVWEAISNLP